MNLDNLVNYKKLDTGEVGRSIELLPDQIRQVLDEARLIKIPADYSKVTQVIINGMGGSNIGAKIIKSAFKDQIKVPISVEPGYLVPENVNSKTLYVISSYSGTTEEPLSTYKEARKRGAKILGITMQNKKSKLAKLMMRDDIPGYMFSPRFNPSGQPRLGLGYSIFGMSTLLAKAGLFKIRVREIEDIIASLEIWTRYLRADVKTEKNAAKQLAIKLKNKIPILIGSEFLTGNVQAMRNHINECSKSFASFLEVPDMNHYAMEGLINPKTNKRNLIFVFFNSEFYHSRVKKRIELTKQVVKKNGVEVVEYKLKGDNKLLQNFELLQLGAWTSYYLGILYKVNPAVIPFVNWFKARLAGRG